MKENLMCTNSLFKQQFSMIDRNFVNNDHSPADSAECSCICYLTYHLAGGTSEGQSESQRLPSAIIDMQSSPSRVSDVDTW